MTGRDMILWPGSCMVHDIFSLQDLLRANRNNPGSIVIAHPECPQNILEVSDMIGGTEKMRRYVESIKEPTTFLVATEANRIHPLEKAAPQHKYLPVPGIMGVRRRNMRVQSLSAHGAEHTAKGARLPEIRRTRNPAGSRFSTKPSKSSSAVCYDGETDQDCRSCSTLPKS